MSLPGWEWIDIPAPGVRALCKMAEIQPINSIVNQIRVIEMLGALAAAIPEVYTNATQLILLHYPECTEKISAWPSSDSSLKVILTAKRLVRGVNTIQNAYPGTKLIQSMGPVGIERRPVISRHWGLASSSSPSAGIARRIQGLGAQVLA